MPLYGDPQGEFQGYLQMIFLVVVLFCAFLILVPKPLILWLRTLTPPKKGYFEQHDEPGIFSI